MPDLEGTRSELEKAGLYFLPQGDFERYVIAGGFENEYADAFGEVHGSTRMESYFKKREASDPSYSKKSRAEKIVDCINQLGGKPEIALEFSRMITQEGTNLEKIPPYFVKVLREIERIAKREIEIEKVGESGT